MADMGFELTMEDTMSIGFGFTMEDDIMSIAFKIAEKSHCNQAPF